MSRRNPTGRQLHPRAQRFGATLLLLALLAALLPAAVSGQDVRIRDQDVEQRWQLLTYRDAAGDIQPVPAGIGATLQLFANSAFGDAACSSYESRFTLEGASLFIDPPSIERVACDPASEDFDEDFYRNLAETASVDPPDSIMTLRDVVGEELMTLTRAVIDDDPTVARWELKRLGSADGAIEPVIAGLDPWIEFLRGGRLVGNTGCGSFLGSYVVNDGTMAIDEVAYRLDCPTESAGRQAEQMVSSLSEITDFEVLPAGLALRDGSGITRLALAPVIDLGGRTWTPTAIYGPDGEVLYDQERLNTSAVKFRGRSFVEGRSICRPFKGDGVSSGLALSVTAAISLEDPPCGKKGDLAAVETAFVEALERTSSHALRGPELELKDVDGVPLMRLLPQPDLVGPTWVVTHLNLTPGRTKVTKRTPKSEISLTATFEDIEVVLGDTGAADNSGTNFYVGGYRTPAASRIDITDVTIEGRACGGRKSTSQTCKQEGLFITLLETADSYIVREGELRLLQGTRPLIWFTPEVIEPAIP